MYYDPGKQRTNYWLDDKDRPLGPNRRSLAMLRQYKQLKQELSRNLVVLYFLMTRMGMGELRTMFYSAKKQKQYVRAVIFSLKEYAVTEDWEEVFVRDIRLLHERCEYVLTIIRHNLKLTEYMPYFTEVGFDKLVDFSNQHRKEHDDQAADDLEADILAWNAEHADAVKAYMDSIADEKAAMEAHRARIAEQERAEKKAAREQRKAENAEVREIRKNEKAYKSRQRKIERSFERYYK